MLQTIDLAATLRPQLVVIENVCGFEHPEGSAELSPLQFFVQKMANLEYAHAELDMDLSWFQNVVRRRIVPSCLDVHEAA